MAEQPKPRAGPATATPPRRRIALTDEQAQEQAGEKADIYLLGATPETSGVIRNVAVPKQQPHEVAYRLGQITVDLMRAGELDADAFRRISEALVRVGGDALEGPPPSAQMSDTRLDECWRTSTGIHIIQTSRRGDRGTIVLNRYSTDADCPRCRAREGTIPPLYCSQCESFFWASDFSLSHPLKIGVLCPACRAL